jgi:hypothetical protein
MCQVLNNFFNVYGIIDFFIPSGISGSAMEYFITFKFSVKVVWPVPLAQALPRPQLILPFKTWFFGFCLNFQWQKSLENQ